MAYSERLTLLAAEAGDLPPLSALVQDAIVRAGDIGWDRRGRRLVLIASRYRWEAAEKTRVRTALRIDSVLAVKHIHWPRDPDAILELLAITNDDDTVELAFAGGIGLRAQVECLDIMLEDLSAAWGVRHLPQHN